MRSLALFRRSFVSAVIRNEGNVGGLRNKHTLRSLRNISLETRGIASGISKPYVVSSKYSDVVIPDISFTEYVFNKQEKYIDRIALTSSETGAQFTHGEVRQTILRLSSALSRLGVSKGDMLAIVSPNCPEFLFSFMASAHIGAIITTVNSTYTPAEILKQIEDSGAKTVISHVLLYPKVKEALRNASNVTNVILIGKEDEEGTIPFHKLLKDDGKAIPQNISINPSEDLLVLPYSSGTTGLPKGVMLTHRNIIANIEQLLHPDLLRIDRDENLEYYKQTFIGLMPLFHIYGMVSCMMVSLCTGAEMVTVFRFDPDQYISVLRKHKPTVLHVVPPILAFLTFNPKVEPSLLSSTRFVANGAAPTGPALLQKFMKKFNHKVGYMEGFGMTESSPVTHMTPKTEESNGSCGQSLPNTLTKIVDLNTGETLGPDEGSGELCIKGPQVMKGYYTNPEATKKTIVDGWLHTGDIARMDSEQNIYIVDRLKELIKVKGLQVAPAELENILREHPDVQDAAVIGIPDKRSGELPKAFVIPVNGSKVTEAELLQFVEGKVAPHKQLSGGVSFVESIPKSDTGKILRRVLKEQSI